MMAVSSEEIVKIYQDEFGNYQEEFSAIKDLTKVLGMKRTLSIAYHS